MSNKNHINLDQLVIAIILSSSKTKQAIDQLIVEVREMYLTGMMKNWGFEKGFQGRKMFASGILGWFHL